MRGVLLCALLLASAAWPTASSREGTSVFVEVLDAAGRPLAGVPVSLLSVDATGITELRAKSRTGSDGEPAELSARRAFFELPRLPSPPRRLARVDLPTDPLAGVELPDALKPGDHIRLQLAPDALACSGELELRVVDPQGEPVADVPVRLEPTHWDDLLVEATTDARGVLRIPRVDIARFREQIAVGSREACALDLVVPASASPRSALRVALPPARNGPVTIQLAPHGWLRACLRSPSGAPIDSFHARPLRWSHAPPGSDAWSREWSCTPLGGSCHLLGPIPLGDRIRVAFSPGPLARSELHEFPPLQLPGEVRDVRLEVESRSDRPLQGELPRPRRVAAPETEPAPWRVSGSLRDDVGQPVISATVHADGPRRAGLQPRWSMQEQLESRASFDFEVPGRIERVTLEVVSEQGVRVERSIDRDTGEGLEVVVPRAGSIVVSARLPQELRPEQVLVSVGEGVGNSRRTLEVEGGGELVFDEVAPGDTSVSLELVDFPWTPLLEVEGLVVGAAQLVRDQRLTDIDVRALITSMQLQFGDERGDTASTPTIKVTPVTADGDRGFGCAIRPDARGRCELVVPANVPWIELTAGGYEPGFEPVLVPVRPGPQHVPLIPR